MAIYIPSLKKCLSSSSANFFFNGVVFCCFLLSCMILSVCEAVYLILRIIKNFNFKNKDLLFLKVLMHLCSSYLFVY